MVETFTIKELLQKGIDILEEGDFTNPLLDIQLLLSYTLNVDKVYIYTHRDAIVEKESVDKFLDLVHKRKEGYPIQYILGKQEFMGLDFFVGEGVLVPRPDTEVLIESIIDIVKKGHFENKKVINVVDVGTGSGAITVCLAYYLKKTLVYSIDISEKALSIAKENCNKFSLDDRVKFLQGDLLQPLVELKSYDNIDIIVSNPPYIPSNDIDCLQKEVSRYEPRLALDGGLDGLDYYRRIIQKSPDFLVKNGLLAFEIGYNQGHDVAKLMEEAGKFKDVEIIKDLAGHDRVVLAYRR